MKRTAKIALALLLALTLAAGSCFAASAAAVPKSPGIVKWMASMVVPLARGIRPNSNMPPVFCGYEFTNHRKEVAITYLAAIDQLGLDLDKIVLPDSIWGRPVTEIKGLTPNVADFPDGTEDMFRSLKNVKLILPSCVTKINGKALAECKLMAIKGEDLAKTVTGTGLNTNGCTLILEHPPLMSEFSLKGWANDVWGSLSGIFIMLFSMVSASVFARRAA